MSEAKIYKKQEVSEDYVAEPMAMEYSTVAEDAGYLDDDILVDAIKYTQTAREKGADDSERGSVWFVGRENGMEVVFEEISGG